MRQHCHINRPNSVNSATVWWVYYRNAWVHLFVSWIRPLAAAQLANPQQAALGREAETEEMQNVLDLDTRAENTQVSKLIQMISQQTNAMFMYMCFPAYSCSMHAVEKCITSGFFFVDWLEWQTMRWWWEKILLQRSAIGWFCISSTWSCGWLVQLCIGWQTSHLAQGSNLLKENFLKQQNSNLKITAAFGGRGTATLNLF